MAYHRKDTFYERAKASGYRSRAAYKLIELNQRYHLIRPGDRVVDLGAWPGGWLQVAAGIAGPKGIVVGVDRQPIEPLRQPCVRVVLGDICDENVQKSVAAALGREADVILSDLAPKLSGVRARDEAEAAELFRSALDFADRMLRRDGRLLVKIFSGPDLPDLTKALENRFERVKTTRPDATRRGSAELYALGFGFRRSN